MMLAVSLIFVLFAVSIDSVPMNVSCPAVSPRELDLKELDGKWYLSAVATDLALAGDCAMVTFSHKNDNTTDVSISWISNDTVSYYNGSVALTVDPSSNATEPGDLLLVTYTDKKSETYSFLDIDYNDYAVIFACYDNDDGNSSTYELWKLTRTVHVKHDDDAKFSKAITKYNLQDTNFIYFDNTEETCKVNGGSHFLPPSLVMTSAAAITLFRRM